MARYRMVKPEFYTDERVLECSVFARMAWIGLSNHSDDWGNHPASAKMVKAEVFPADDLTTAQVEGYMSELEETGLTIRYQAEGKEYWHIADWENWQKIDRPQAPKYPVFEAGKQQKKEATEQPSNVREPFDEHSANVREPFDEHSANTISKDKINNTTTTTTPISDENGNFEQGQGSEKEKFAEWLEDLENNFQTKEAFSLSRKIPKEKYTEYLGQFRAELKTRESPHRNLTDFRQHFLNFSGKIWEKEQKEQFKPSSKYQKNGSKSNPTVKVAAKFAQYVQHMDAKQHPT